MKILDDIAINLEKGKAAEVKALTEKGLKEGLSALEILNDGLLKGMGVVGIKFKNNEIFIPEVLIAARAMKTGVEVLKPELLKTRIKSKGKFVIGTVKGDLHDIGKNLVIIMFEGAGFKVIDLGTNVPAEKFVEAIEKESPDIIGMSALLTTTMTYMQIVMNKLRELNIRDKVKVMVGGAPVTQNFADEIGADAYAIDASTAVELANSMLNN